MLSWHPLHLLWSISYHEIISSLLGCELLFLTAVSHVLYKRGAQEALVKWMSSPCNLEWMTHHFVLYIQLISPPVMCDWGLFFLYLFHLYLVLCMHAVCAGWMNEWVEWQLSWARRVSQRMNIPTDSNEKSIVRSLSAGLGLSGLH